MTDFSAKEVIMLGAGGHARVLQETLFSQGVRLAGYIAPDSDGKLLDTKWLGDDAELANLDRDGVLLVNGLGSTSAPRMRRRVYEAARHFGFEFQTVIDPSATVKSSAQLGRGVQVLLGALVGTSVSLEDDVIINSGAVIDHDCVVGAHSHISPGVVLAGGVRIGESSHVGLGARVIQGVTIGSNCTVGAGAVVIRDIPKDSVAMGVPAAHRPTK